MMHVKTVDVFNCARCGDTHERLKFTMLHKPMLGSTYWASCPKLVEPILLTIIETTEEV